MIKSIDTVACTNCGLCEKVCPVDLFRSVGGTMTLAYQADCCNCMQCRAVCPVDAISFAPVEAKKYDMDSEWPTIKDLMGAVPHPMAAETAKPAWMKKKEKAAGGWPQKEGQQGSWNQ